MKISVAFTPVGAVAGCSIAIALNTADDPEHWRKRAEEARAIAVQLTDAHTKAIMLTIPQDYEKLAVRAEQRAKELR